jgi:hypothetical protein
MNAFSPQEIRDRIMGKDSVFQSRLIEYLESAHQGEFTHGTLDDVRERVRADPDVEDLQSGSPTYKVPTQILPEVPLPMCKGRCEEGCQGCLNLARWFQKYEHEVDDLLLRSNVHKCRHSVQDEQETEFKKDWRHLKKKRKTEKKYYERRGCLNRHGVCKARFPRDVFGETNIDQDGHINLKKREPNMNTFAKVITYFSRSNTDVGSLLSGTAVKAVVSYVSDYVSKLGLKTYQAFASVFDVFQRNSEMLDTGTEGVEAARTLMRQMINSMSTKMEIGSPTASMYILGNPDHYTHYVPWSARQKLARSAELWIGQRRRLGKPCLGQIGTNLPR